MRDMRCSPETYPRFCVSKGFPGSSIQAAIDACDRNSAHSRSTCASDVKCTGFLPTCYAYGFAGESIEQAVDNCDRNSSHSRSSCRDKAYCATARSF